MSGLLLLLFECVFLCYYLMMPGRVKTKHVQKSDSRRLGSRKPIPGVLGINLRRERTKRRISVEELARKAGCSPEFVLKIESGEVQKLKIGDAESFATALGVELTVLLERSRAKGA